MKQWYLIHTKIKSERMALENLQRRGFICFLPQKKTNNDCRSTLPLEEEPLFPRCLFIQLSDGFEAQGWASIQFTSVVNRLVSVDQVPVKVNCHLVARICEQTQGTEALLSQFKQGELGQEDEPVVGLDEVYQMADGVSRVTALLLIISQDAKFAVKPNITRKLG